MLQRIKQAIPDALDHFPEGVRGRDPRTQRQGVDEKPHESVQIRVRPTLGRRTDRDVLPARVAVQEGHDRGQNRPEQTRPGALPELGHALPQNRRQLPVQMLPGEILHRGPRAVARQLERLRQLGKLMQPVGLRLGPGRAVQPGSVPSSVVDVSYFRIQRRRGLTARERRIAAIDVFD